MPNYRRHITRKQVERALAWARRAKHSESDDAIRFYHDGYTDACNDLLRGRFSVADGD